MIEGREREKEAGGEESGERQQRSVTTTVGRDVGEAERWRVARETLDGHKSSRASGDKKGFVLR